MTGNKGSMAKNVYDDANKKMLNIESARIGKVQDLYIVAGQLQENNIDPIDSWTFFVWLQKHNIPSKYLVKKDDDFYKRELSKSSQKDIVVLESFNKGYELLDYPELWIRACAFVVEWDLGGGEVDFWIRNMTGCRYVFLQHGIIWSYSPIVQYACNNIYNDINVFSETEKKTIEETGKRDICFLGGLPRYDLLTDESNADDQVVLVMFTWRNFTGVNSQTFLTSAYWRGLTDLLSHNTVERLGKKNIRFVVALHHSLLSRIENNDINLDFISQHEIAYWIRHAHALITDFSSVSFDFLFLHKPVIYWIPDKAEPLCLTSDSIDRKKASLAAEKQRYFINVAETLEDVLSLVEKYSDRRWKLESSCISKIDLWFGNRNNISQRVYEQIKNRVENEKKIEATLPSVSVIIPIYNAERHIETCMNSVLKQRYSKCEIILVNDGSTDNSLHYCNLYASKYGRITVIDKPNGGVSSARNEGIKAANGDYIVFMDVDDYMGDNYFTPLINATEDIIFVQYKCFDDNGRITEGENVAPLMSTNSMETIHAYLSKWLHQNIMRTPWGKFFKRSVISDTIFPIGQKIGEDSVFCFNVIAKAKSMKTFDNVFYMWRTHSDTFIQKYSLSVDVAISYLVNELNAYKKIGVQSSHLECTLYFTFFSLAEKAIGVLRWKWFARPIVYAIWKDINYDYKKIHEKKFKKYRWFRPLYKILDNRKFPINKIEL